MKSAATIILALSFVSISVFGVFLMGHGMAHDANLNGCIGAMVQGKNCPNQVNPLNYIAFHLNAFRSFTTATFSDVSFASLLFLSLLAIGISLRMFQSNLAPPKLLLAYNQSSLKLFGSFPKYRLLRWLSLLENSPANP